MEEDFIVADIRSLIFLVQPGALSVSTSFFAELLGMGENIERATNTSRSVGDGEEGCPYITLVEMKERLDVPAIWQLGVEDVSEALGKMAEWALTQRLQPYKVLENAKEKSAQVTMREIFPWDIVFLQECEEVNPSY